MNHKPKATTKKCKCGCGRDVPKGMKSYATPACQRKATKARNKDKRKITNKATGRKVNFKTMKKKAWGAFSLYIRLRGANRDGICVCVTCKKQLHYKKMQAGHLIGGRSNSVLFREDLVYPQCYGCNCGMAGNYIKYVEYMNVERGYSMEEIYAFDDLKKKTVKYTISDMAEFYEKYTKLAEKEALRITALNQG